MCNIFAYTFWSSIKSMNSFALVVLNVEPIGLIFPSPQQTAAFGVFQNCLSKRRNLLTLTMSRVPWSMNEIYNLNRKEKSSTNFDSQVDWIRLFAYPNGFAHACIVWFNTMPLLVHFDGKVSAIGIGRIGDLEFFRIFVLRVKLSGITQ